MNKFSEVVIVGAGPAGASLAIRLAMAGHAVKLIEKERFPREKLCGEFISPECFRHFAELGVRDDIFSLGGSRITETRFFDAVGRNVTVPTRWFGHGEFALGLSRARMDEVLLSRAKAVGVEVHEGSRVTEMVSAEDRIVSVELKCESGRAKISGDLFVDASGRVGALSRLLEKRSAERPPERSKLIALKNHLTDAAIEPGVCEIYVFDGGYGGLSSIEEGKANLCFITAAEVPREIIGITNDHIGFIKQGNVRAAETLKDAVANSEWLAVPIGLFGKRSPSKAANLVSVGDAAAFIDPFTGSGMLMAMESSELLAKCIAEADAAARNLSNSYEIRHAKKFRTRLAASSMLRHAAFMPRLATAAIMAAGLSDRLRERLARATRSGSMLSGGRP